MSADNGGPAFPTREKIGETFDDYTGKWHDEFGNFGGMTLRDYFAAKYLEGYMANPNVEFNTRQEAAEQAYAMADAMLIARSRP